MTAARQDTASAALAVGAPDVLQHPHGRAATIRRWTLAAACGCGRPPRRGVTRARTVRRRPAGHGPRFERRQRARRRPSSSPTRRPASRSETVTSEAGFYRVVGAVARHATSVKCVAHRLQGGAGRATSRSPRRTARGLDLDAREPAACRRPSRSPPRAPTLRTENAEISGTLLERRDQEPAAGGARPLRARAPHARRLRPRRARRRRQLRRRAQPVGPGRLEQLGLRHREPGAGQRQRPARRGEQLPARRRHGDEPGLGRRRRRHAEPGIGEGDSRHLEQLLGRERTQHRRAGAGGVAKRHQRLSTAAWSSSATRRA